MSRQETILIVDDKKINRDLLGELLKPYFKIKVAKSGALALKAALREDGQPDLILLDIMMPDMDGYEVCRKLKSDEVTKGIPVIFVTAMGETSDKTKGFDLGAVDYITKPVSPPILMARVKTHLYLKRVKDSLEDQVEVRTKELHSALIEVKASEHAKSEFMARMSHELRTPLNAIITPISLLIDKTEDSEDKITLKSVNKSANELLNLIKNILDFSGLETGSEIIEEPFQLDHILSKLDDVWSTASKEKKLNFNLKFDSQAAPNSCIGDPKRLEQALEQILNNAVKFTDSGSVILNVAPAGMFKGKISYRFEVSDTGIGINPEKVKSLFDPFTQEESTGTRKHGGIGLGLAMAKDW